MSRRYAHLVVALLSGAASGPVLAQAAPTTQDIVVTAEKRSELVQSVPISVSVLSSDQLQRQGVKDLFQTAPLVNGIVFSRAPDDGLGLTFRGLGTISRSANIEQPISLQEDGVPFAKGRLYTTAFFDVERIEFVKGNESSLIGKNSSVGAINVVNRQPGDTLTIEGSAGYEFLDGGYTLDAATNLPLGEKAAVRFAAHYNDLAGWVHNDALDRDGPKQKDLGVRGILRFRPTERLTLTASYQHGDDRQIGQSMQLVGAIPLQYGGGLLDDHNSNFTSFTDNNQTLHRTVSDIGSLTGKLELGDYTLISQNSYVGYRLYYLDDLDFSTDDTVDFRRRERYRQYSQELRIQSPTGQRIDYMAGFFFLASHWHSLETQFWAVPDFPPRPNPASGQLFNGDFANDFSQDTRTYAGYASGHLRPTDRLTFAGGIRYSHETKGVVTARQAIGPITIWNSIANPPFDPTPLSHRSDFVDGNVSAQYAIRPDILAYASFGHGSKAGGFVETNTVAVQPAALVEGKVPAALVASGSSLKDETSEGYEIGVKSQWLDRRLRINAALFLTIIHNFQDNVFTGGTLGFITFNGPARSRGVDLDTAFRATRRLSVDVAMTYADATAVIQPIDPTTNTPEADVSGKPVLARYPRSQAPKVIVNAGAAYVTPLTDRLDIRFEGRMHHRSSMYNQRQNGYPSQALTTLDLTAGVASHDDRWEVDLVAKNVTDAMAEDFASATVDPRFAAFYGAHAASPNRNRTLMLSVRIRI